MAQTVQEWAVRAATLPAALVDSTPRAVVAAARVLDQQVVTNVRTATGGDGRLSRVRSGRGARITTRVRTVGSGSRTRAEVVPGGPIMLIEDDTRRHQQPFRYGASGRAYSMARRRKASRRGFLFIPGVGFRSNVNHPGTKGKQPVRRAFQQSGDDAGRAGVLVFQQAVRDHLRS